MTYPDGREINYDYGTADAIDDIMSRLASIKDDDDSTVLASYRYLGASRIVTEDYEEIQVNLDYAGDTNTFSALDRFGRVADQVWNDYQPDPDVPLDAFSYGYDRVGNRVWKENVGAAEIPATPVHLDELYDYDLVNQLSGVERGNLVDGQDGKEIDGTPAFTQDWDLDALGNWGTFNDNGTSQTREVNEANEIEKIDTSTDDVAHDAAGNMIRVPKLDGSGDHFHLVYDAWNRLVEVYDDNGTTLIAQYQYDATGRRIVKGVDDGTDGSLDTFTHYFHSGTQVIETREGDDVSGQAPAAESLTPKYQNIWSPRYIDSMILRDEYDAQGDIITANRVYYLSDANYNVTALVDASGDVIERYLYTPYGTVTVLDPDFSVDADGKSDYDNTTLYTGREFDPETELMYYRARYYHSELGRFASRDPIGYLGGNLNLFGYVSSNPVFLVDPSGWAAQIADWYQTGKWGNRNEDMNFVCGDKEKLGWQVRVRVIFTNCSDEAMKRIQENICDSYAATLSLNACLHRGGLTKTSPIVQKWFGNLNDKQWAFVKNVIKRMKAAMDNSWKDWRPDKPLRVTCTNDPSLLADCPKRVKGADPRVVGAEIIGGTGDIRLGGYYYGRGRLDQALTYMHELTHLVGGSNRPNDCTRDFGYWNANEGCYNAGFDSGLPPWIRIHNPPPEWCIWNASTYEEFFREFFENQDKICPSKGGQGRDTVKPY